MTETRGGAYPHCHWQLYSLVVPREGIACEPSASALAVIFAHVLSWSTSSANGALNPHSHEYVVLAPAAGPLSDDPASVFPSAGSRPGSLRIACRRPPELSGSARLVALRWGKLSSLGKKSGNAFAAVFLFFCREVFLENPVQQAAGSCGAS